MLHEAFKNFLFGITSFIMIISSVEHSLYIVDNFDEAYEYYFLYGLTIVITCLFVNVCLGIFSLFILGNLNDFLHKMCVNLVGAQQKLKILAILMVINCLFFLISNVLSFLYSIKTSSFIEQIIFVGIVVFIMQVLHIISIESLHPDLFGKKWRKRLETYENKTNNRTVII